MQRKNPRLNAIRREAIAEYINQSVSNNIIYTVHINHLEFNKEDSYFYLPAISNVYYFFHDCTFNQCETFSQLVFALNYVQFMNLILNAPKILYPKTLRLLIRQ